MIRADLYLDRVDLGRYLSAEDCRACGFEHRADFLRKLAIGELRPDACPRLDRGRLEAIQLALHAESVLPVIEVSQVPAPGPPGLTEINGPGPGDPVLVSGNSLLTMEVMGAVLSSATGPFYYLVADTGGDTVDMALVLGTWTPRVIQKAIVEAPALAACRGSSTLVIPGLAVFTAEEISLATGFDVTVGPVCAAEIPACFGERWRGIGTAGQAHSR